MWICFWGKNDSEGLWICSILEELFRREHETRKGHLMIQITKLLGGLVTPETFSERFERSGVTRDRNVQRKVEQDQIMRPPYRYIQNSGYHALFIDMKLFWRKERQGQIVEVTWKVCGMHSTNTFSRPFRLTNLKKKEQRKDKFISVCVARQKMQSEKVLYLNCGDTGSTVELSELSRLVD